MERRTRKGYKLRVYIDAIKEIKSMSDDQWVNVQSCQESSGLYLTRSMWLYYLEMCALQEAECMLVMEAA